MTVFQSPCAAQPLTMSSCCTSWHRFRATLAHDAARLVSSARAVAQQIVMVVVVGDQVAEPPALAVIEVTAPDRS
jgi:hypothetical protein